MASGSVEAHRVGREIPPRPRDLDRTLAGPMPGSALAPMTSAASLSDAELAARVATGDEAAFGAVYERYADVVYGATVRFMRDHHVAEEVVQDAYVTLWRLADRYDPDAGSLLGWLLHIARNKAIDRMRSAARRPRAATAPDGDGQDSFALELALETAGSDSRSAEAPDEAAIRAWTRAVVRTALSVMPETERLALELAYDEGLTQLEIAERTGWPLGTVKTRTRRALANLRTALEGVPGFVEQTGAAMSGGRDGAR